jgi:hypothetical protein
MGAVSGLLLAVILIAGVTALGGGSAHLDLIRASGQGNSVGLSTQSAEAGGTTVAPQTGVQTTMSSSSSVASSPVSSLAGLENRGGGTIGLLLLPVLLGALIGAVFYGAYGRRIDSE